MPWYDQPDKYYRKTEVHEPLSQGDIVVAPAIVIMPGTAEADVIAPTGLDEARTVTLWRAAADELPAAPSFSAQVSWRLAMVVPHSCAMEKEWNERVVALKASGLSQQDAESEATADDTLDKYITLAPIFSYDVAPGLHHRAMEQGTRLGVFPVCGNKPIPRSFVDFSQLFSTHYQVVPTRRRLASLSDQAMAFLQNALAMHFAYRALSKLGDLETAVGRRIESVQCTKSRKSLTARLILDDGKSITLRGDPSEIDLGDVPERPARDPA